MFDVVGKEQLFAVNHASDQEPVIRQAYVVWQNLLYLPAFLENPELVRRELALLTQGDAISLETRDPDQLSRYQPGRGGDRHIRFVGRVVSAARAPWTLGPLLAPASGLGHIPYAIEPSWRVRSITSRHLPADAYAHCRLHAHLYPYGIVNLLICTYLRFPRGLPITDFVLLLRELSPQQKREPFTVQTPYKWFEGGNDAVVATFADNLAEYLFDKQGEVIWGQERIPRSQGSVIQLIETDPPLSRSQIDHARQMRAVVTLRPNWHRVADEKARQYQRTDFGEDDHTWVIIGGLQMVVYTGSRSRRKRQRFFWRLAAVAELARIEVALYMMASNKLQKLTAELYRRRREFRRRIWPSEWFRDFRLPARERNFWRDFPAFRLGLEGGQRKLYKKLAESYHTAEHQRAFLQALNEFSQEVRDYKTLPQEALEILKDLSEIAQGVTSVMSMSSPQ